MFRVQVRDSNTGMEISKRAHELETHFEDPESNVKVSSSGITFMNFVKINVTLKVSILGMAKLGALA